MLDHVATRPHAARNRLILLLTHWAGMRVGEVAGLLISDVIDEHKTVRPEIRLDRARTKRHHARSVFVNHKLRREIMSYYSTLTNRDASAALFATQKRQGFSANTLCHTMRDIYHEAGFAGASSHSGRRSFITTLASKGVGVRVLASLAGHKSIATTQRYIDINDDMKRQAVELL